MKLFLICRVWDIFNSDFVQEYPNMHITSVISLLQMKREIRGMMSEQKEASTRAMTDLDARMGYMKTRMNEFEDKLEARVATVCIQYTRTVHIRYA